jgi:hypothetical protein
MPLHRFAPLLPLFLTASVAGTPAAAAAEKPLDSFGGGVNGVVGVGTPVGLYGIEGRLDLVRWLFLTAGVGVNPAPQIAATAHLRVPLPGAIPDRQFALSAGYGLSGGEHKWDDWRSINFDQESEDRAKKVGLLWWQNVQLGAEARVRSVGLPVIVCGLFAGMAVAMNPGDLHCYGYEPEACERRFPDAGKGPVPYGGAFAGFWFH